MKRIALALPLILALAAADAGNLYRWVDQDGKVHYTDTLPPPEAKSAERKKLGDKGVGGTVPYSLQVAIKNFPVTVFNAKDCGEPCKLGMALLNKRGVPYTEKNARDPASTEELSALTGGKLEVPVLTVGRATLRGYEEGAWNNALDTAGYPRSPVLPQAAARAPAKPGPAAKQATPPAANDDAARDSTTSEPAQTDAGKPPS